MYPPGGIVAGKLRVKLPDQRSVEDERVRREAQALAKSFRAFVEAAWPIVEPGSPFLGGYHIDAICEHLQAAYERRIKRLLVNVPPRTGKSTIISVLFPAWVWANNASEQFLYGSYALELATRDSLRTRRVLESEWYQKRWPHVVLRDDQNMKKVFENTETGHRQVVAVNSSTTGLGGTFLVIDDPHNVQHAESAVVREAALTWFRESWATRSNTKDTVYIVVMQRVHQMDVSGYCLEAGGWDHLKLPMEYEAGAAAEPTSIGWKDPRTYDGEPLWPARYGPVEIADLKKTMGSVAVAAQLQQRPVPRGGATFKNDWMQFWYDEDLGIPEPVVIQRADGNMVEAKQKPLPPIKDYSTAVMSWDLAFKGGEKNDFVVGQAWVKKKAEHFLLGQERGRYDFPESLAAMRRLKARFPQITPILVEEKANGAAAIITLKQELPGIVPIDPEGGKVSRASAVAPLFEAGNVWLPHPEQHPWVQGLIDELCMFPRGHDDQVDATSQALIRLQTSQTAEIDPGIFDSGFRVNPWAV